MPDISQAYQLANDSEFRLLARFGLPPRAGQVKSILGSGAVTVAVDDQDGGTVTAWPLNGFTYAVDDVVYIAYAGNTSDSAIVVGSKAPAPTLDASVLGGFTAYHDGVGGHKFVTAEAVDGTAQTLIANGAGDVTARLASSHVYVVSAGPTAGSGSITLAVGASANIYSAGGDTFALAVAADGSVTVQRTAGSATMDAIFNLMWI